MAEKTDGQGGIDRRRYLGLAAVTAVAGCTDAASSRAASASNSTTSSTETAAATTTATKTATDARTETESTETAIAETTETPAETASETTADDTEMDAVDRDIATARDALGSAHTAFLNEGGEETLADVTAASYPFETDDVFDALEDAERALRQATAGSPTAEQDRTITDLESITQFLEVVAREQEHLATAYWWVEDVRSLFFDEEHSTASDYVDAATDIASDSGRALDDLEATIDASAARSVEQFDAAAVSGKLDQMRAEIETLDAMKTAFDPGTDGLVHLWNAVRAYKRRDYADAMTEYGEAADDFGDAVPEFEDLDPAPAFESNVEGMADATAVLEAGCDELAAAAAGKADGADTMAEWRILLAHERFDSNDDVAEMPSIADGPGGD